jgi:hypothetical protein
MRTGCGTRSPNRWPDPEKDERQRMRAEVEAEIVKTSQKITIHNIDAGPPRRVPSATSHPPRALGGIRIQLQSVEEGGDGSSSPAISTLVVASLAKRLTVLDGVC